MDLGSCRRIGFNVGGKSLAVVVAVEMVSVLLTYLQQERIIHYFMVLLDTTIVVVGLKFQTAAMEGMILVIGIYLFWHLSPFTHMRLNTGCKK